MTSKEVTELLNLNFLIIQYPHGISIYQTSHINNRIIQQWFPEATELFNSSPTTFNSYITFELSLSETLLDIPAELHLLEERYLVKSSTHIVNILHIIQYTLPDVIYAVDRLCIYADDPSAPSFQGVKNLTLYLAG